MPKQKSSSNRVSVKLRRPQQGRGGRAGDNCEDFAKSKKIVLSRLSWDRPGTQTYLASALTFRFGFPFINIRHRPIFHNRHPVADPEAFVRAKPCVQLYTSAEVGMGKSHVIQDQVKQCNATYIRIPFNGAEVDLDFLVERCWSHSAHCENLENDMERMSVLDVVSQSQSQAQQQKEESKDEHKHKDKDAADAQGKIIYHLDISACAGEDINNHWRLCLSDSTSSE